MKGREREKKEQRESREDDLSQTFLERGYRV